jgi:methylthioribose-1-phosphate isomerase
MEAIKYTAGKLTLLDQTLLPNRVEYKEFDNYRDVVKAIKTMQVRGAPAIGVTAAYALVLAALEFRELGSSEFKQKMAVASKELADSRPTAVNLFWAIERMKKIWQAENLTNGEIFETMEREAQAIQAEDLAMNETMGEIGQELIAPNSTILTHCNAGALATAGFGTALGVIRAAFEKGKVKRVFADETRPLLQGARLTAYELMEDGIPVTLITDNMAGYCMQQGWIDCIIVGADRIAANGDVANKIGTYGLAVLAKFHKIPFYVAAPYSTFDLSIKSGQEIPIEERKHDEVRKIGDYWIAPEKVEAINPAFDVTPHSLITAIITDKGLIKADFQENIKRVLGYGY